MRKKKQTKKMRSLKVDILYDKVTAHNNVQTISAASFSVDLYMHLCCRSQCKHIDAVNGLPLCNYSLYFCVHSYP